MDFNLTDNPFYILQVSVRDNAEHVSEAFESRVLEGTFKEETLHKAQRDLLGSKSRLAAEISWLLELSPNKCKEVLSKIGIANREYSDVIIDLPEDAKLARANVSSHFVIREKQGSFLEILTFWGTLEAEALRGLVNSIRNASGFPQVTDDLFRESLNNLKASHAEACLSAISSAHHPGRMFSEMLKGYFTESARITDFLDLLTDRYNNSIVSHVKTLENKISKFIEEIKASTNRILIDQKVEQLVEALKEWDEYCQPSQLVFEKKGLDDPRSKKVFQEVRSLVIDLANEKQQHEVSLHLAKQLLEIFPELPSASITLSEDISTLTGLVKDTQVQKELGGLSEVITKLFNSLDLLVKSISSDNFKKDGQGPGRELYDAIFTVLETSKDKEIIEEVFSIVGTIAKTFEKRGQFEAAQKLLKPIIDTNINSEELQKLKQIFDSARKANIHSEFNSAFTLGRLDEAILIAERGISSASSQAEKKEWQIKLDQAREKKSSKQQTKIVFKFIGITAVLLLIIASYAHNDRPKKSLPVVASNIPVVYPTSRPKAYTTQYQVSAPTLTPAPEPTPDWPEPWKTSFPLVQRMLNGESVQDVIDTKELIERTVFVERGNIEEARKVNQLGLTLLNKNLTSGAYEAFDRAVKLDKGSAEAWNNLAYVLMLQQKWDDAVVPLMISLSISPSRSSAWANVGQVTAKSGDATSTVNAFLNAYLFSKDSLQSINYLNKLVSASTADNERMAFNEAFQALASVSTQEFFANNTSLKNGVYVGNATGLKDREAQGSVTVSDNEIEFSVIVKNSCTGGVKGTAIITNEEIYFVEKENRCRIRIVPSNDRFLAIEENCLGLHGAECSFTGMYKWKTYF